MKTPSRLRIFLCLRPTNMSFGFDRLRAQAQQIFQRDPLTGHLFLFLNRRRDRIKILFWDTDGLCLWYKRLEAGTFQLPKSLHPGQGIELSRQQLAQILAGIDLQTGRRRQRYQLPKPTHHCD